MDGRVVFVNTLFGCLATVNERYSFEPLWQPAFLSKLSAEDRCHFGYVDVESGKLEPITFCPGYARGLAFRDNYAVVGLSKCRQERTFSGLPLEENLSLRKGIARCGTSQIAGI